MILLNNPIKNIVIPSGLVPKGAYDNSTDYAVGDYVTYLGTSYVMFLDAPAGTLPTDTTYWQILASKGNTGGTDVLWELDGTTLQPATPTNIPTLITAPTSDMHIANKKYVDDTVAGENMWDRTGTVLTPYEPTNSITLQNTQSIYSNSDDALIKNLSFYKSRGTYASPTGITTGDYLGEIVGYGYDGSNYIRSGSIRFKSAGTIGTNRLPSTIEFWNSTNAATSVETLRGTITVTGIFSWNSAIEASSYIYAGNYIESRKNNIITTSTDSLIANNATAATSIVPVQMSPRTRYSARVWNTTGAGSSETSDWIIENLPTSGTTPTSLLKFGYSRNGGTYTYPMTLYSSGTVQFTNNLFSGANIYLPTGSSIQATSYPERFTLTTGTATTASSISRNTADAYSAFAINNANASSTGNILDLQWQGTNRISFTKNGSINLNTTDALGAGTININGNRYFHAYSPVVADNNLFLGYRSGNFTMAGTGNEASYNIGVGAYTLLNLTTGRSNLAFGVSALQYNSSGGFNVALGVSALEQNTTSSNLTAIGNEAFKQNTTGTGLVAVGYQAGKFNVKGANNSYFGYQAGYSGTTVVSSITITNGGTGYTAGALIVDNTGTGGTGLAGTYTVDGSGVINGITITNRGSGYNSVPTVTPQAGGSNAVLTAVLSSADYNTAIGYQSSYSNTYGDYNTAHGYQTLYSNTTGVNNSAFGALALLSTTIGNNNVAMGINSGRNNTTGSNNIYIGYESAYKSGVTATGSGNVFMGYQTGINNTASNNVFIGYQAGYSNTSANYNIFLGYTAGYLNTTGQYNTAQGYQSLASNVGGNYNTAFGYVSLYNATGTNNVGFGANAGRTLTNGENNTFLGKDAGYHASQKVDATNSMALGYQAYTDADNQVVIGNASVTQILCGQDSQAEVKAGKLETTVAGEGVILKSPDGTRYKITVANDGTVTSTAV